MDEPIPTNVGSVFGALISGINLMREKIKARLQSGDADISILHVIFIPKQTVVAQQTPVY